jgi:hypothetical protein
MNNDISDILRLFEVFIVVIGLMLNISPIGYIFLSTLIFGSRIFLFALGKF